jgi:hypothetical protein
MVYRSQNSKSAEDDWKIHTFRPFLSKGETMTQDNDNPLKFRDGKHMRSARIIAGLTRVDLAAAAHLHPNSIKYWETDRSPCWPGGPAIDKISSALATVGVDTEVEQMGNVLVAIVRRR